MNKIGLKHNPYGDTRSAPKDTTFDQFHSANVSHIKDVRAVMDYLATKLHDQGQIHDWTKLRFEQDFFKDFQDALLNGADFVNGKWYQLHIDKEKHHPLSKCHDDITLLDIIEMVVDCVCAGKARTGEARSLEIDMDILKLALDNTVKLIDENTEVVDE